MDILKEFANDQLKENAPQIVVGDTVRVKYMGTDERGRMNLSMRDAQ